MAAGFLCLVGQTRFHGQNVMKHIGNDSFSGLPKSEKITHVASLGMSCQTAHQLSRYVEPRDGLEHVSGPMDWMCAPAAEGAEWLSDGMPSFEPDDISIERGHPYWADKNVWFWHWFRDGTKAANDPKTRAVKLQNTMERELSKFSNLAEKFRALDPDKTLFVFSNSQANLLGDVFAEHESDRFFLDEERISALHRGLETVFGQACKIQFVTRIDRADPALIYRQDVSFIQPETSGWKGSDLAWSLLLDQRRTQIETSMKSEEQIAQRNHQEFVRVSEITLDAQSSSF